MKIKIRDEWYIGNSPNDDVNDSLTIQRTDISKLISALNGVVGVSIYPLACEKKIEYNVEDEDPRHGVDKSLYIPLGFQMDREVFIREYILRGTFDTEDSEGGDLEMNLKPYSQSVERRECIEGVQCNFFVKCTNNGVTEAERRLDAEEIAMAGIRVINSLKDTLTTFYRRGINRFVVSSL